MCCTNENYLSWWDAHTDVKSRSAAAKLGFNHDVNTVFVGQSVGEPLRQTSVAELRRAIIPSWLWRTLTPFVFFLLALPLACVAEEFFTGGCWRTAKQLFQRFCGMGQWGGGGCNRTNASRKWKKSRKVCGGDHGHPSLWSIVSWHAVLTFTYIICHHFTIKKQIYDFTECHSLKKSCRLLLCVSTFSPVPLFLLTSSVLLCWPGV